MIRLAAVLFALCLTACGGPAYTPREPAGFTVHMGGAINSFGGFSSSR